MLVNASIDRGKFVYGFLLAFLLIPHALFAQGAGSVQGKVSDKETGEALIGANVTIENTGIGAASDLNGEYLLRSVAPGTYRLRVTYIGYDPVSVEVKVSANATTRQDFRLIAHAISGEVFIVMGQAKGQMSAVNQQLASNTISNIVAADRIKELPDVNAAESIGRLPGVSIDRWGGEATAVAIRGLAPKYNTITVNGVALPATNNNDRSVDLSLVSSNMLDGIELKKANTPDMDADALGGTVDLRLKEAPEAFQMNATVQGGYNQIQKYTGNYNVSVGASDRFFDGDLGMIAAVNADRYNRSADQLNAGYRSSAAVQTLSDITVDNLTVRETNAFKSRLGGNLLLDYKMPFGKITGNGFYSQAKTDGTYRQDNMDFTHNSHYYQLESDIPTTSIYTSSIGIKQDFGWLKYDFSIAATGAKTDDPNDYRYQFAQENSASTGSPTATTPLLDAWTLERVDTSITGLSYIYTYSTKLVEKQKSLQFNVQVPFHLTDDLTGYVKTGGKFRWLDRMFDQEQWGCGNLQYGGSWTGPVSSLIYAASQVYPDDFNVTKDSTIIAARHVWPISRFLVDFGRSNFLDGQYQMGMVYDLGLMRKLTNVMRTLPSNVWQHYAIGSLGSDYDGIEHYGAGYIMAELNIGPYVTLLSGVRYDADYSKYHGQSFREVIINGNNQQPPGDLQHNENVRQNNFWLPMVHLKIQPADWLIIRLAGTETVTRPDYLMYAPITNINVYQSYVRAANGGLRDSRSKNLDASISIYQNYVGLLTLSPFYKSIDDLIMYTTIPRMDTTVAKLVPAELNIPQSWLPSAPQVDTYMNNPNPAVYKGIEFDWQTNFWYLPSFLQGLVLNFNWTYITSTIDVRQFKTTPQVVYIPPRTFLTTIVLSDTIRRDRMPDQPAHIANITIGYDYKGFSIRASYLSQSDKVTGVGQTPITDAFTAPYRRWDLAVQQKLGENTQLFASFNNLNNRHDESLIGYRQLNPTSIQYYGLTIDLGIRYKF
jgi:TonB-dependent receptor